MTKHSTFWSAYNSAVKQHLLRLITPPKDNEIFVLPFTVPFTLATEPLTNEEANYLVYNLANTILSADGSKGSYDSELNAYLKTVDQSILQDPGAKKELERAETDLKDANEDFEKVEKAAKARYAKIPDPKPPFEQWVVENYTSYTSAKRLQEAAQGRRDEAYNKYYGRLNTLHEYQNNLKKALDTKSHHQSFNMSVWNEGESTFKPSYSSPGLRDQLNSWIQDGGREQVFFETKIDSTGPPGSSEVESGIYVRLMLKGVEKLDIHAGPWDLVDVKTLYPKRESGAPNVLDPKYARPISVLIAYGPRLEVEIRGGVPVRTPATNDKQPYVTVLGILGQHLPAE